MTVQSTLAQSALTRTQTDKDAFLANVALLYYGEGLTQSDIAQRMKVSRATIVNMLREARERGIVEIRVDGRSLAASNVARELRERFGLADVYVSRTGEGKGGDGKGGDGKSADPAADLAQLARVAASAFCDILEPGDRVGVEWSRTVHEMAQQLPRLAVEGVEVCQMVGSMVSTHLPASESCAILIANALSARCYTLHAPALVANAELAGVFLSEPTIRAQLERLSQLDMIVTSIGTLSPDTHLIAAGMATPQDVEAARAAGARGIMCCRYVTADGRACRMPPDDRLIAVEIEMLQRARKRLLVVRGEDRAEATLAAIRGGLATHLCVNQPLAEALLRA